MWKIADFFVFASTHWSLRREALVVHSAETFQSSIFFTFHFKFGGEIK